MMFLRPILVALLASRSTDLTTSSMFASYLFLLEGDMWGEQRWNGEETWSMVMKKSQQQRDRRAQSTSGFIKFYEI